jgi:GntR family transcriptional regulator
VADLLRSDIVNDRLTDPLPQEWELTRRYRATRNEMRDAMALLQAQSLVRRVPGAGTFTIVPTISFNLDRTDENVWAQGRTQNPDRRIGYPDASFRCLNARVGPAPDTVAHQLRIDPDDEVLYAELVVLYDGEPQRLRSSWVALATAPGIEDRLLDTYLPEAIAEITGQRTYSARTTFDAFNADVATAALLAVPPQAAILYAERHYMLADGRPAEFGFTRHRGDRSRIVSNWLTPGLDGVPLPRGPGEAAPG